MRHSSFSPALCLVCLLACVAYRGAVAAEDAQASQDQRALIELGQQQLARQEYEQAIQSFQRSLQSIESHSGPFSLDLLEPLDGLAKAYSATRQYEAIVGNSVRALAIVRR